MSTFLDPNTQKVQKITKMPAVILLLFFSFFFSFSKNKVSLSDATVCVDASKEYLQFLNKSQSQGSNAPICENPTASFQKCFSCLFWCIVVKMKMCQQIKNVSKLFFYIKGIPQNFCPSEALQGSWKASYLFRASQQASIPIQGLLASLNPHSGPLGKSQALLGPPGKPQALFRALKELFSLDEPKLRTLCNLSLSLSIYIK